MHQWCMWLLVPPLQRSKLHCHTVSVLLAAFWSSLIVFDIQPMLRNSRHQSAILVLSHLEITANLAWNSIFGQTSAPH